MAFDLRLGRLLAGVGLQPADDSIVLALYCCVGRGGSHRRHGGSSTATVDFLILFSVHTHRQHHAPDGNTACQFALSQAQASEVVVREAFRLTILVISNKN